MANAAHEVGLRPLTPRQVAPMGRRGRDAADGYRIQHISYNNFFVIV